MADPVKAIADKDICQYINETVYNTHKDEISKLPYLIKVYPNEVGSFQEDNVYVVSKKDVIEHELL